MPRLLVALLAAVDAAIAAAVGLVVLLAPLTLLWTIVFGATADWGALWPLTGTLWQFGHGVPIDIRIADELLKALGIAPEAARFTLSLTPMAFLLFTLLFAARSGVRAARSGAWIPGVVAGAAAFTAIAAGVALTAQITAAQVSLPLAILMPAATYLCGALAGAVWFAWHESDGGPMDRLHDLVDGWGQWSPVPAAVVRGAATAVVALTGAAAIAFAVTVLLRGGEVVALFETVRVDAIGGAVVTLGNLAYLPTLLVWTLSWLAGPGFAVGTGTAVSPAGTQLGVVPGIPVLGLLPETDSFWMLIVVLVPVAAGAFAGWVVRSQLVWDGVAERLAPRAVIAAGIALLTAAVAALAAVAASGSIGPGRLAHSGPDVGPMALAIGTEVLIGAVILLLAPRHRDEVAEERTDRWVAAMGTSPLADAPIAAPTDATASAPRDGTVGTAAPDWQNTAPLEDLGPFSDGGTRGDGSISAPR